MPSGDGSDFLLNQPNRADDCRQLDAWGAITGWQTEYQQVGRGAFDGRLTVGFQGDVQVNRCVYNRELLIHASPPKETMSVVIPYSPGRRGLVQGNELKPGQVVVVPSGAEGFFRTLQEIAYFVIMLPEARMFELIRMNHPEAAAWTNASVASFPEPVHRSLHALGGAMVDGCQSGSPELLTEALMEGFCHEIEELSGPRRLRNRLRYVRQARDYFEGHLTDGASLSRASATLGINRRTLEMAFKDILDMSPLEYLRIRKLRAIRDSLRSDPEKFRSHGIGVLAAQYGMAHAGHFSRDYKTAFGELPSDTVRG